MEPPITYWNSSSFKTTFIYTESKLSTISNLRVLHEKLMSELIKVFCTSLHDPQWCICQIFEPFFNNKKCSFSIYLPCILVKSCSYISNSNCTLSSPVYFESAALFLKYQPRQEKEQQIQNRRGGTDLNPAFILLSSLYKYSFSINLDYFQHFKLL